MTIPECELTTMDRLKTFVDNHATDFINEAGAICEQANRYNKLDKKERKELFKMCKSHFVYIKRIGKLVQEDLDE